MEPSGHHSNAQAPLEALLDGASCDARARVEAAVGFALLDLLRKRSAPRIPGRDGSSTPSPTVQDEVLGPQLRVFNGGVEQPLAGERRVLVPSQRDVPTYDRKPQMSAREITDAFLAAFQEDRPAFSVINFANADMVGHTGVIPAAILAVETIDECLGRIVQEVHRQGGVCVITADHGNAEEMLTADGAPNTAHTTNPVPLVLTARGVDLAREGTLADVAPTVLALLGIEPPDAMRGHAVLPASDRLAG